MGNAHLSGMKLPVAALAAVALSAQSVPSAPQDTARPKFRIESAPGSSPARAEPVPTATRPAAGMGNDAIVKLVKAGMGESTIIGLIASQPGNYAVDIDSVLGLKQAGVPDSVISAMAASTSSPVRPSISAKSPGVANPISEPLVLHEGTPVRLRLKRNLSSASSRTGDTIDFEVLEEVLVDKAVVIERGAVAIGAVTRF